MAFMRQFFWAAVWGAWCFVAVGGVFAAEDTNPSKQPDPPATLEQALDKKLAFDLDEVPLSEVIDWLRSELKISIHLGKRSPDYMAKMPIIFHLSCVPVRSALDLMLKPYYMTWLIQDEVLVFTTIEIAGQTLETKTYDVADLVVRHDDRDRLIEDYGSLIEMITTMVLPASWDEVGGLGSIAPYGVEGIHTLVVSQTREGHERVAALLAALRAVRKQAVARKDKPARTAAEWAALSRGVRLLQTPEERAIFQALGKPISVDFEELPLTEVVEHLGKQLGVPTHVAIPCLNDVGIGTDTPITCSLHNVPARSVLDCLLREVDLTWLVRNDVLYVTTIEAAEENREIGVYDVADLIYFHDSAGKTVSGPDFDSLIEMITTTIDPTTWDEVGGPGSITCFQADGIDVIVFIQSQALHEKASVLLNAIREMRKHAAARENKPAKTAAKWNELSRGVFLGETPSERTIGQAMGKCISVDFKEAPLVDVLKHFGKQLGVPVLLDQRSLDDVGIPEDCPVTCSWHELPARDVLDMLLGELDMTWLVRNDVLLFTTIEQAETRLEIGIYDVADLIYRHDGSGKLFVGPNFDRLVELLTTTVQPITWDQVGGPGSIAPLHVEGLDVLIVAQTQDCHEKIAALLTSLRNVREQPKDAEHVPTPEEKTLAAMGKRISLDLRDTPFTDAIGHFRDKLGIQIVFDRRAFDDMGFDGTEPVTIHVSDVRGQTCLELLLAQLQLSWTIQGKVLLVTSVGQSERLLVTRVYDIADLVQPPPAKPTGRSAVLGRDILAQFGGKPPLMPAEVYCDDAYSDSPQKRLIEAIECAIAPASWDTVNGPGTIEPYEADGVNVLVVSQTWPVHQKIEALLASLRAAPRKTFATRPLRHVSPVVSSAPPMPTYQLQADPQRDAVTAANNAFACALYDKLRESAEKDGHFRDNLFFSPYSLSTALSMANRLWGDHGQPFLDTYLTLLRDQYGADLVPVDFSLADKTAGQINHWVAEATKNKITRLVDASEFTPDTRLVLTDAIYFEGKWTSRFDKNNTRPETFFSHFWQIQTPMMHQRGHARYARQDNIQVLEMPYGNGALAMMILLPKRPVQAMEALEKSLSAEKVQAWASATTWQEVDIHLPRFKVDGSFMLKDTLEELGMRLAMHWKPGETDFSGIGGDGNLYLEEVVHKALVEVDEEGAVAAAATAVMGCFGGPPPQPVVPVFRADHPFVFLIRDTRTGAILFLGRLTTPEKKPFSQGKGGGMF